MMKEIRKQLLELEKVSDKVVTHHLQDLLDLHCNDLQCVKEEDAVHEELVLLQKYVWEYILSSHFIQTTADRKYEMSSYPILLCKKAEINAIKTIKIIMEYFNELNSET